MPSRMEQVANIIERRSSYLPKKIATVETELQARASALYNLETHREALLQENANLQVSEYLKAINFSDIQERISSELLVLSKLRNRFSRNTLNIGVIGLMGQGKSTLLKSLSGLSDREIPAYEGAACTAVRSVVCNQEGSVEVRVVLHSEKTFLEEVILLLNYLAEHILEIDEEYARQSQERLIKIQQDIDLIIQSTWKVFSSTDGDLPRVIDDKYDDLFGTDRDGWWREITIAFQELRLEFAKRCQLSSQSLESSIKKVYKDCKENAGILTANNPEDEINKQIQASNPMKAYGDYRDLLRTLLSDRFNNLDEGLKESTEEVKARIAKILITSGRLGILPNSLEGSEFIKNFRELLEKEHSDLKRLQQGFQIIDSFELSYSGLIEPQIYQHLVSLSNIQLPNDESQDTTLKVEPNTTAELILNALQIDYDRTVARIKAALEELLYQPSIAAYARIEKFIDNIIYHKEAQKDWKKLLRRVRAKVWTEEIGELEREQQCQQDWLNSIKRLEEVNRLENIQFLT